MDNRKFQSASSASPPAVEASPSTGYPTDGNPSTAVPATIPGARWFHQIGEELRNVIASAGLTPSDSDLTQLQQAIAAMIATGVANDFKASVRIATTANIASLTGLAAIDGVTPIAGDRILVKDQSTGSQNGIYVAAAGAWSRATDADTGAELNGGALVSVEEGTTNAETIWALTNDGTVTIGSTALVFQWAAGLNGVTAAQFDNSRKLATTAFVQGALGNLSNFFAYSASATVPIAYAGCCIQIAAAMPAAQTLTLPAVATMPIGAGYWFENLSANSVTIKANASEQIQLGLTAPNSFVLYPGETIFVHSQTTQWDVFGATAAQVFNSSLGANGYQKLPSGLIVQWGVATSSGTADTAVSFPISFPTGVKSVTATPSSAAANSRCVSVGGYSTTGFSFSAFVSNTAGRAVEQIFWCAIGY